MMGSDQKDIFAGEGARMVQGAIEGTSSTLFVYGEHSHGWLCPTHASPREVFGVWGLGTPLSGSASSLRALRELLPGTLSLNTRHAPGGFPRIAIGPPGNSCM